MRVPIDAKTARALILPPRLVAWVRTLGIWRQRAHGRVLLSRMVNREFHDIGITSAEAWLEIRKPFWRE
jgi:uncharacterized protein YjiS (DUF1127 family)